MDETSEVEAVVRSLLTQPTLFLSTSAEGEPWGAGAFFVESGLFTLSLGLELHGRTLTNIRNNPRVALVVSNGNPFEPFLQGAADAEVLDDDALEVTAASLLAKAPQIEPFLGAPMAAVRLHVRSWRATDVANGWLPGREIQAPASSEA